MPFSGAREIRWATSILTGFLLLLALAPAPSRAEIDLVSRTSTGEQAGAASYLPSISGNGRYVAFTSDASNLAENDPDNWYFGVDPDVFVYDRETGAVENASAALNREGFWYLRTVCRAPSIDAVGRFVAFECFSGWHFAHTMQFDIFLHDRELQSLVKITNGLGGRANSGSAGASISADGRHIAFSSTASNLLPSDPDMLGDVYVYDREAGSLELASIATGGAKGNGRSRAPAISADGRFVAFVSEAGNLVPAGGSGPASVYVRDRETGTTEKILLPPGTNGTCDQPAISGNGRKLAFTVVAPEGEKSVFLADFDSGSVRPLVAGHSPSLSADGRFLAFASADANAGAFLLDLDSGRSELISSDELGGPGNGPSSTTSVSAHGAEVAFASRATNLYAGDTNGTEDVFLYTAAVDTTPPNVSLEVSAGILWPPNKKYVPVRIDGLAVDETELDSVEITVSDEYGEMAGMTVPGFGSTVWLESWREGDDMDGRIYTIRAVSIDVAGNRSEAEALVVVPHDLRDKR